MGSAVSGDLPGGSGDDAPGDGDTVVAGAIDQGTEDDQPGEPLVDTDPSQDQDGDDPPGDEPPGDEPVALPTVTFSCSPASGPRALVLACAAVTGDGADLPEGVYTWTVDGVQESGPVGTHARRTFTLSAVGEHRVRLRLTPTASGTAVDCLSSQTGLTEAVAVVWPRISGQILDVLGEPVSGATVSANNGGTTTVTDEQGGYAVDVPYNWSGQVQPRVVGYELDRVDRSYTNVTTDVAGQGFEGTPHEVQLSGYVRDGEGRPLPDMELVASNGGPAVVTDSEGHYQVTVGFRWAGEITLSHTGYAFDPPRRSYSEAISDLAEQGFTATPWPEDGTFTDVEAVQMLRSLPSYTGGPRILAQLNTSHWVDYEDAILLRELTRAFGGVLFNVSYVHRGVGSTMVELADEFIQQGHQIWLEMGSIGGLEAFKPIEALDPNYLHDTPKPAVDYIDPDCTWTTKPNRVLFCPCRHASRRQIARWFAGGLALRNAGLDASKVSGIWVHDEIAMLAGLSPLAFETVYTECSSCGSMGEYNRRLAELHADILHAMLRGLGAEPAGDLNRDGVEDEVDMAVFVQSMVDQDPIGDLNNDGRVDDDDLTFWRELPRVTPKPIDRFWWGGAYNWRGGDVVKASGWLPIDEYPDVPRQTHANFANYYTCEDALMGLATAIDYNLAVLGRPSAPWFGLTYDKTVGREVGVDPALNRQKARLASERGCPLICCYALNAPEGKLWMTPALYRNQFENVKAIVVGSRP